MSTVIKVENVSKQYRLGLIGTNTLKGDLQRWWYNIRGLDDPTLMIGQENSLKDRSSSNGPDNEFVWALRNINLEVKQGEILGIIGKNGAGKSTLLKLLSRVTAPTTGSIKVKGRIASLLEVGTGFHPDLTGRENIFLNGAILGMSKTEIHSKFDEIVDFSGCELYIDTPVKRYSSGMYVRLAFAVAAHLEPEILIVDEVLAVGDGEFQKKALGKMQDVSHNHGRTILFVSHNMTAIKSLCTTGLYLKNGTTQHIGPINGIIDAYLSTTSLGGEKLFDDSCENEFVKLIRIELIHKHKGVFKIDEELQIKIKLINKSVKESININLFFKTVEGTIVFADVSDVYDISIGEVEAVCTIPANFLNDIIYLLDLMIVANGEKSVIYQPNVLSIEGVEPTRNSSWLGKYPGFIRPHLNNWEIIYGK